MKIPNFVSVGMVPLFALAIIFAPALFSAQAVNPSIVLCEITRSLAVGSIGEDVRCLQRYLNWAGFTIASPGAPGSAGYETQYFGPMTRSAVARWQEANFAQVLAPFGLSTGTGFWGSYSFSRYVQLVRIALGVN